MMRTGPGIIVVTLLGVMACGGGATKRTTAPVAPAAAEPVAAAAVGPALPPPAPEVGQDVEHVIDAGVLRGLMIEGELRVPTDDGTVAAMRSAGKMRDDFVVDVCLAPDGTHEVRVKRMTMFRAFNNAVSRALRGWRFRPYVRDGVAARACARAAFKALDDERLPDVGARLPDALPSPAVELPANAIDRGTLDAGTQRRPPTPRLAMVRICRTTGRHAEAPAVTLLQSSGDPAVDRELLDRRIVVPADETAGERTCLLRTAVARTAPPPAAAPVDTSEVPQNIAPTALVAQRISGDTEMVPSDAVKEAIAASGDDRLMVPVKICLDDTGEVATVALLKPSGYLGYDADVLNGVATWRYRPFMVDGRPTPVCSAVMFIYKQRP